MLARRGGLGLVVAASLSCDAAAVSPVNKVIQLLERILEKGKEAKHDEEVNFSKLQQWCDGLVAEKTRAISDAAEQIESLSAAVQAAEADASGLAEEIAGLQAAITKAEGEAKSATGIRNKEEKDYATQHADFSESVDAIERAIQVLKTRSANVPQALLQVTKSRLVDERAKALVNSFLRAQSEAAGADYAGAPEANAYEFQSTGVVATLENLRLKFQDQVAGLEKEEMNAKANYEVLMQQLTDNVENDKKVASDKTAYRAKRLQDAAKAKQDLSVTSTGKGADETILADTKAECHSESTAYEKNQVLRKGEVVAIEKALEILSSSSVSGHADTYLPAFTEVAGSALTQLRRDSSVPAAERAAAYLQDQASILNSRYLAVIANHVQNDPFGKVKKMIHDLIVKLQEEANEEADHHGYCTSEMAANKLTREDKTTEVEKLRTRAEELTALAARLADEVSALTEAVADLRSQQSENSNIRSQEQATNSKTIADAKEAQLAVGQAINVLRDYYADAAKSTSAGVVLLQGASESKANQPYQGQQGDSTGVLGMLDVIMSDFARLETETARAEEQAAAAHKAFVAEADQDIAVKEAALTHREENRQDTAASLLVTKRQLDLASGELDAAQGYHATLQQQCVDKGLSYAERKQQREEEVQSLKEALNILDPQNLA